MLRHVFQSDMKSTVVHMDEPTANKNRPKAKKLKSLVSLKNYAETHHRHA
jgi:hypothetical protein